MITPGEFWDLAAEQNQETQDQLEAARPLLEAVGIDVDGVLEAGQRQRRKIDEARER